MSTEDITKDLYKLILEKKGIIIDALKDKFHANEIAMISLPELRETIKSATGYTVPNIRTGYSMNLFREITKSLPEELKPIVSSALKTNIKNYETEMLARSKSSKSISSSNQDSNSSSSKSSSSVKSSDSVKSNIGVDNESQKVVPAEIREKVKNRFKGFDGKINNGNKKHILSAVLTKSELEEINASSSLKKQVYAELDSTGVFTNGRNSGNWRAHMEGRTDTTTTSNVKDTSNQAAVKTDPTAVWSTKKREFTSLLKRFDEAKKSGDIAAMEKSQQKLEQFWGKLTDEERKSPAAIWRKTAKGSVSKKSVDDIVSETIRKTRKDIASTKRSQTVKQKAEAKAKKVSVLKDNVKRGKLNKYLNRLSKSGEMSFGDINKELKYHSSKLAAASNAGNISEAKKRGVLINKMLDSLSKNKSFLDELKDSGMEDIGFNETRKSIRDAVSSAERVKAGANINTNKVAPNATPSTAPNATPSTAPNATPSTAPNLDSVDDIANKPLAPNQGMKIGKYTIPKNVVKQMKNIGLLVPLIFGMNIVKRKVDDDYASKAASDRMAIEEEAVRARSPEAEAMRQFVQMQMMQQMSGGDNNSIPPELIQQFFMSQNQPVMRQQPYGNPYAYDRTDIPPEMLAEGEVSI